MKLAIIFISLFLPLSVFAQEWTWAGYEIVGYKTVTRAQIEQVIPIQIGSKYDLDQQKWNDICGCIRTTFKFYQTRCSAVQYLNFKAFFTVEIIERGDEARIQFREPPSDQITLADNEVQDLYDQLYKRVQEMFSHGIAFKESHDKGYLDFDDPQLSQLTEALAKVVPKFHNNLFAVLKNDKNSTKRAQAANLLNWDLHANEDVISSVKLLDDPAEDVRNNISRFAQAFVGEVKNERERHHLINLFLVQLMRPSHGDRNKALYSLLNLVTAYPADGAYIKQKGLKQIQLLAAQSILYNVRDVAIELQRKLP